MNTTNVMVLGRTGDGKSAACNFICRCLGMQNPTFEESDGANAHTHIPKTEIVSGFKIIDNPGLMDTNGVETDEANIRRIVTNAREAGYFNAVLILVNNQANRFNDGMLNTIKMYVDSFGPDSLTRFGILYSRCSRPNATSLSRRTNDILSLINRRCNTNIAHIPFWYIDCHPERLAEFEVPQTIINQIASVSSQQISDSLRWAGALPQYSTEHAVFGEYEQRRLQREAQERADEAERRRVYEASVISRVEEMRTIELCRNTVPILQTVECSRKVGGGGLLGGTPLNKGHTVSWTETRHIGNRTEITMREEKREVVTYGSGNVSNGEWMCVREWIVK